MTEAEFLEVLNLHAGNSITSFSLFITYLFGFVAGAYVVGSRLPVLQVLIITGIYVASSVGWILSIAVHVHSYESLLEKYPAYSPSPLWEIPWSEVAVGISSISLVASIYFLHDVRSRA